MPKFIEDTEELIERIGAFEASDKLLDELQEVVGNEENSSNEIVNKVVLFIHEKKAELKIEKKELTANAMAHMLKLINSKIEENAGGN